jgi:hypothetical protein
VKIVVVVSFVVIMKGCSSEDCYSSADCCYSEGM